MRALAQVTTFPPMSATDYAPALGVARSAATSRDYV